ncbi:uncharacterized protein LOC141731327 isoform X2 [Zonotrichia albicollis]
MGRHRAPAGPCWTRLLRAGGRWVLELCGTALRGLRRLWSLAWVGTARTLPQGAPRTSAGSKRGVLGCNPRTAAAVGVAAGVRVQSLHCCCCGCCSCLTTAPRVGAAPPSLGAARLKALGGGGCAQRERSGRGDTALLRAGASRPLAQVLLMCYKSCWDGAFQVTEELGTALQLRLEGSEEEEEDVDSDSAWQPAQTGQWRGQGSEAVLARLEALEADVRFLCTELGAEKLLWSSRFLELLREQQSLRQRVSDGGNRGCQPSNSPCDAPDPHTLLQLQELPWNSRDSPELLGEAEDPSASGSEGESPEGRPWMEAPQQARGSIQRDRQKM